MKMKLLTAICAFTLLAGAMPASAQDEKSLDMVIDAGLVRPTCLAVTVAGSAVFVILLPFSAISKSVKRSAHTLVATPARDTFTRPLGDFAEMEED